MKKSVYIKSPLLRNHCNKLADLEFVLTETLFYELTNQIEIDLFLQTHKPSETQNYILLRQGGPGKHYLSIYN